MTITTVALLTQEDDAMDHIAKRVAQAQTKEDVLILLAKVARHYDDEEIIHNENLVEGATEGLLSSLHNALLLRDGTKRKYYRTSMSHNRALQCTVLVTAIEMMLRCSTPTLANNLQVFRKDLIPAVAKIIQLFIAWEGGDTIRLLTISNTVKIIRRIGPLCLEATESFVGGLLNVLRGGFTPAEIHVEAASALAHLFDSQNRTAARKHVIELIQDDSSLIISTLSTAALAAPNNDADETLSALFNFAVNSHTFRSKLAKRRCTILAIGRHLASDDVENRKLALNICKCLLNDHITTTVEQPARLDSNTELLIDKVIKCAVNEREPVLQLYAISLLGDAVRNANLQPAIVENIMDALKFLVDSDRSHEEAALEASVTYTKAAAAMQPESISKEVLVSVADFTTLPFARTRTNAIATIDYFVAYHGTSSSSSLSLRLLEETELLENFSLILSYGSEQDCTDAMNVLRLLARNPTNHSSMCQSSSLLNALVQLVTSEDSKNAFGHGVEAVLALLSNNDNVRSFLPFVDLVPFLVSFANTVSDEEMKQKLVSAIVRLTSAILG